MTPAIDPAPDDIEALRAALLHERAALAAERLARREAEARASGAEAMVAHLKLLIAQLRHDRFGASSERGRKLLDPLELQLEEGVVPRKRFAFRRVRPSARAAGASWPSLARTSRKRWRRSRGSGR